VEFDRGKRSGSHWPRRQSQQDFDAGVPSRETSGASTNTMRFRHRWPEKDRRFGPAESLGESLEKEFRRGAQALGGVGKD
jgi:hypothetical protein